MSYIKLKRNEKKVKEMIRNNTTKAEIARQMKCSWITVYRYLKNNLDIPKN